MRLHRTFLAGALVSAALAAALPPARAGDPRHTPVVDVVKRVKGAVVNIHSERTVQGPASEELFALTPSQNRINGMGTGILVDPRGYIITNHHVVEDVNLIRVRLADGTSVSARVLARDAESDLALLKIDVGRPLPVMPLGTATDLMVGETVIAIGNAYGYDHTVTVGVVSAVKRDVTLNKEISYKSLIQTDASINPGNSGGPLCNINGELVGVNVAIRAGAQGIGFAIPVDSMIRVAADMMSIRKRNGTWHGLVLRDQVDGEADGGDGEVEATSAKTAAATGPRRSLVVERVEASGPAALAGLKAGDVLVRAGDQPVTCSLDLERALLDRPAGERVPLVVRREGKEQRADLALLTAERAAPVAEDMVWRKLGLRLQPVSAELVSHTNQQLHGGLVVAEVRADGVAAKSGIQRGDILVGLHQWEMLTLDNVVFVLTHPDLASFNPLRFYIVRSGQVHRGWIQQVE
jgi:serine protease Do